MFLQSQLNLEEIKEEMKMQQIDLNRADKFQIAIEDFIEEFRAKCERRYSNQKMLNLCFAVLWVFLMHIADNPGQFSGDEQFSSLIEKELAQSFLGVLKTTDWSTL